jgi:YHS domain-containing protein
MLGWLLRILVVLLLVRAVWRFVRGLLEGARPPTRAGGRDTAGVPLVKDPVCGTYVVKSRALTSGGGDSLHYFCSERCREAWQRGGRRTA